MSFLAIIPLWLGCFACYLASTKQQAITIPINRILANSLLAVSFAASVVIFSLTFSFTSSLLAAFVVLMLALISHTILTSYIKNIWFFNGIVVLTLLLLTGLSYVA